MIDGLEECDEELVKDLVDLFSFHCSEKCPSVARPILKLLAVSHTKANVGKKLTFRHLVLNPYHKTVIGNGLDPFLDRHMGNGWLEQWKNAGVPAYDSFYA